ncbi:hypothetical protein OIE52_47145 [Streptomyces canus]|uniref:hypothetical protein n=1 Tax=Streptomyces canus TaxID=58343 RepID=UPI002E2A558F|nr:hypothetical protein [Streptomyces canus]
MSGSDVNAFTLALDLGKTLKDLGVWNVIQPAAARPSRTGWDPSWTCPPADCPPC